MEEKKKNSSKKMFTVLASISAMIMLVAVIMIYTYTKQIKPDVVDVNAQSNSASENVGYINEESPQELENDSSQIQIHMLKDSQIFIIGAGVFMAVIVASFAVVKVTEHKDD